MSTTQNRSAVLAVLAMQKQADSKDKKTIDGKADPTRNPFEKERGKRNWGAGGHQNREQDVEKGSSRKEKHKKDYQEREASLKTASLNGTLILKDLGTGFKFAFSVLRSPVGLAAENMPMLAARLRDQLDNAVKDLYKPTGVVPGVQTQTLCLLDIKGNEIEFTLEGTIQAKLSKEQKKNLLFFSSDFERKHSIMLDLR